MFYSKLGMIGAIIAVILLTSGCGLCTAQDEPSKGANYTEAILKMREMTPPPGQMVDMGGYKLHIHVQGKGSPTVVFESGWTLGSESDCWQLVASEVANFTRVVTYDRAGLGWSDVSPRPKTDEAIVDDLHTLLKRANISGPYILAGHSLGGVFVRMYAHKYPEEVAGMVLVDSSHPKQNDNAVRSAIVKDQLEYFRKLAGNSSAWNASIKPWQMEAAMSELADTGEIFAEERAANITSLGNIPLVVMVAGKPFNIADAPPGMLLNKTLEMLSETTPKKMEEDHIQLEREFVKLSPQGKLVMAKKSGHNIQFDQPDLVIDAIREVVIAVREGKPLQPS